MGVTGLWKLIEPCGKPVPVETLEGKILAVDISIWLHQVVKGFQDNKGAALNNAHLLGLFHRLCKLLYYRVKPVFVFDGCVPQLKKDTIARRQQQRSKLNSEADRIQALLLQSLAKERVVQQALGPNAEALLTSPTKKLKDNTVDDMFRLPELPSSSTNIQNYSQSETTDESLRENSICSEDYTTTAASTDDSSFDELNPRHTYNSNIQAIDVKSKEFLQLPADVRHEILVDIKETRKQSSWGRLHELPSHRDDFSSFQMKRLLKRRDVQVSLQTAEQEMGGRTLTYSELKNIFSEEGILEADIVEKGAKQITSDEHTRFLLVKDLKKKLAKVKEEEELPIKNQNALLADTSKDGDNPSTSVVESKNLGNEFDKDLELAIALSLEDDAIRVYDNKDYEYEADESIKLSKPQRKQLQGAAKGPARAYMIEYAGMNKEEVAGILDKTQANTDLNDVYIEQLVAEANATDQEVRDPHKTKTQLNSESEEIQLYVTDDSDATDSDLEEVDDNNINKTLDLEEECVIEETPPSLMQEEENVQKNLSKSLDIQIDLTKPLEPEDDLFADIFERMQTDKKEKASSFHEIANQNRKNENDYTSAADKDPNTKTLVFNGEKIDIQIKNSPKKQNFIAILNELKEQADDIKNIKLENIKLKDSVIEISDDEVGFMFSKARMEVIEVCDSDENEKCCTTPPPQVLNSVNQSPKVHKKSPVYRTPSKNHSITEFFNVDYVVKRTPDKPDDDNVETPNVKSPFFVKRTPKSGSNSGANSPSGKKKLTNINKSLFDEEIPKEIVCHLDDDFIPLKEEKPLTEGEVLNEAANILKSQKTVEELNSIASDLANERQELENERNRQDRMGMSITQRMNSDCQDLLRLFGIPFIVAPMEAEAQCAFLDIVQLTNGTITDDSDIWLFGGRTVYKNFFAQNKHVMEFHSEQIEKDFNCDRKKLIQFACLVGSDYTTGIHGIGAVTALEILASFTPKEVETKKNSLLIASIENILDTLQRFRTWWQSFRSSVTPPGSSARFALQKKLKNIELHDGFPSAAVVEAYLTPKVDENRDNFSWGYPDVESLREFTRKQFGWTTSKTDEILMPVLKKLNEKRTQQSIRNYFNVKNALSLRQIRVSKRVQTAIEKMSGNIDSGGTLEQPQKTKRSRKNKTAADGKMKKVSDKALNSEVQQINETSLILKPSCSNQAARERVKRASKRIHLPETKQIIPQRERDLAEMEAAKKFAAEILRKSDKKSKKKR